MAQPRSATPGAVGVAVCVAVALLLVHPMNCASVAATTDVPPGDSAGDTLRVFVLPHSHDDVGWTQTPPEYYDHFVRDIYSSVTQQLSEDKTRKFQCVEQYYFQRWWTTDATPSDQAAIQQFVAEGRFEFAVGGWVMPDEAVTDYADLIETMTIGHEFIWNTFGVVPKYGFQCDPFGASSVFAAQSALMGFDAHIIDRINYWEKSDMQQAQTLEFMWEPSASPSLHTSVFTHVLDQYMYSVPFIPGSLQLEYLCSHEYPQGCPGGNFLWDGDDSEPAFVWQYNPPYPGVNASSVDFYATFMVNNTRQRAQWFATNNLLWPFGTDFQWFNASRMFASMDQIMAFVNGHNGPGQKFQGVTMQYASLDDYFKAVAASSTQSQWPSRGSHDFLPYTSANGAGPKTWTGFYTSHSQLKGHARSRAALLRATSQLFATASAFGKPWLQTEWTALQQLRQAVAVLQHHDAVTGTEGAGLSPQTTPGHVGNIVAWYTQLLNDGTTAAQAVAKASVAYLLSKQQHTEEMPAFSTAATASSVFSTGGCMPVVVYNPLGWSMSRWVQHPFPSPSARVVDAGGQSVASQVTPTAPMTTVCQSDSATCTASQYGNDLYEQQPYILHFLATHLPATGSATFLVCGTAPGSADSTVSTPDAASGDTVAASNAQYELTFSTTSGTLVGAVSSMGTSPQPYALAQDIMQYTSYSNSSTGAVSGSYVFHPVGPATALDSSAATTPQATLTVVRGTHLTEVWQRWSPTVQTVTRVYKTGEPIATAFVEVDYGVGPLPGNREVITRYHTNLCTVSPASACATGKGGVPSWFSDNNGQQYQQRTSNAAGFAGFPDASYNISANYAPVVRSAFLRDTAGNRQFAVLTSRTHGAASLSNGELEVMLHRRELQDDGLGACYHPNEPPPPSWKRPDGCPANRIPLNVSSRVYPRLWLVFGDIAVTNNATAMLSQAMNNPPLVLFGNASASAGLPSDTGSSQQAYQWVQHYGATPFRALSTSLPPEAHLLSLAPRGGPQLGHTVVRLQHIHEAGTELAPLPGDGPAITRSAVGDISVPGGFRGLLANATAAVVDERSLSVVRAWADVLASRKQRQMPNTEDAVGGIVARLRALGASLGASAGSGALTVDSSVSLKPQQIRTFLVGFQPAEASSLGMTEDLVLVVGSFVAALAFLAGVLAWGRKPARQRDPRRHSVNHRRGAANPEASSLLQASRPVS